jgi:predicted nucleic-acid-binding Zn-ribbon protein
MKIKLVKVRILSLLCTFILLGSGECQQQECLICGSNNVELKNASVLDFVAERIWVGWGETKIIHCKECGFAFYELRLSDEEVNNSVATIDLKNFKFKNKNLNHGIQKNK